MSPVVLWTLVESEPKMESGSHQKVGRSAAGRRSIRNR